METNLLSTKECEKAQDPDLRVETRRDGDNLFLELKNWKAKSWVFRFEYNRKPGRRGLGAYGAVPITLVREMAQTMREDLAAGRIPKGVRELRQEALKKAQPVSDLTTVEKALECWKADVISKPQYRADCGKSAERTIRKDVLPFIGTRPIDAVTVMDIGKIMSNVAARARETGYSLVNTRRQLVIDLRALFNYAKTMGWVDKNILDGYDLDAIGCSREEPRDRYLNHAELVELTQKTNTALLWRVGEHALWIILSTLCRVGEMTKAEWAHVDFNARTWTIPPANYKKARKRKNKTPHVIHLSDFALRQFQLLREMNPTSQFVFQGRAGNIGRSVFETFVLDMQAQTRRHRGPTCSGALILSGGGWTLHDLRRTGATTMQRLRVSLEVREACLNHTLGGLPGIYNLDDLWGPRKDALNELGAYLTAMQAVALADKVVGLRKAA